MPSLPDDLIHVREFFKGVKMKNLEKYDLSVGQFNIIYPQLYRSYKHLIQINCLNGEIVFFYATETEHNAYETKQFRYLIRFFALEFQGKVEARTMTFPLVTRKEYK